MIIGGQSSLLAKCQTLKRLSNLFLFIGQVTMEFLYNASMLQCDIMLNNELVPCTISSLRSSYFFSRSSHPFYPSLTLNVIRYRLSINICLIYNHRNNININKFQKYFMELLQPIHQHYLYQAQNSYQNLYCAH